MELQYGGSCGVIFRRLARVPQIAFPDRRGSPGPSRCRGSRRWPGSAARTGGPREKQRSRLSTSHPSPSTSTEGTPPNPPKVPECCGLWLRRARFGELVFPFVRQEKLWVKSSSEGWLILSQSGDPEVRCTKLPVPLQTWSFHISWGFFHFIDSLQVFPVSQLGLTPQRCNFSFFFRSESHIYGSKPPEYAPVQSYSDQV